MQISRRDAPATGPVAAAKAALLDFLHGLKGSGPGYSGSTSRNDGGRLTAIELRWLVIIFCAAVWAVLGWLILTSASG